MVDEVVAAGHVVTRSAAEALVFGAVLSMFVGAAALGWRRRWLRHVAGQRTAQERNDH